MNTAAMSSRLESRLEPCRFSLQGKPQGYPEDKEKCLASNQRQVRKEASRRCEAIRTEVEWLTSEDPDAMVKHLRTRRSLFVRRAWLRRIRLLAASACRNRWDSLAERSRRA